jgi:hypothetical protein
MKTDVARVSDTELVLDERKNRGEDRPRREVHNPDEPHEQQEEWPSPSESEIVSSVSIYRTDRDMRNQKRRAELALLQQFLQQKDEPGAEARTDAEHQDAEPEAEKDPGESKKIRDYADPKDGRQKYYEAHGLAPFLLREHLGNGHQRNRKEPAGDAGLYKEQNLHPPEVPDHEQHGEDTCQEDEPEGGLFQTETFDEKSCADGDENPTEPRYAENGVGILHIEKKLFGEIERDDVVDGQIGCTGKNPYRGNYPKLASPEQPAEEEGFCGLDLRLFRKNMKKITQNKATEPRTTKMPRQERKSSRKTVMIGAQKMEKGAPDS